MKQKHTEYHLECIGLEIDQDRASNEIHRAVWNTLAVLGDYFGKVQLRAATEDGIEFSLGNLMHDFAQEIARVVSYAHTTQALASAREASANMFEALAAGALLANRGDPGGTAEGLALVAACEGRPEILNRIRNGEP